MQYASAASHVAYLVKAAAGGGVGEVPIALTLWANELWLFFLLAVH